MNEEEYRKLKREVDDAKAEAERAKGARDMLMKRLASEYDCESLKEARKKLEELTAEKDEAEAAYNKAVKDYEKKWKSK